MLSGVNVALGVTGSIAAVRVVELAHELRRQGAEVRGVMSGSATGIIHPWAVEFATGRPVVTEITGAVEHIDLCGENGWADVLLVAPSTANTIGKMASAIDDTPVTTCATTAIGDGLPVVVAPAMHEPMADHPGVIEAITRLEDWGVAIVEPRIEEGKAKIADDEAILLETARATGPTPLAGEDVVVTAGATKEAIDPVRILTNRASGRTGRAVARACYARGADVTLVHDDGSVSYAEVRSVESTAEMIDAVSQTVTTTEADALFSAAAISDYTMDAVAEKIRSGKADMTLPLTPTPKLLDRIREAHPDLTMVGFKVETSGDDDRMVESAREIIDRVGLAFVVANDASVMGAEDTRALVVRADTVEPYSGTKAGLGLRVADELSEELNG